MPPKAKSQNYQQRVAKWRRQLTQQNSPAFSRDTPVLVAWSGAPCSSYHCSVASLTSISVCLHRQQPPKCSLYQTQWIPQRNDPPPMTHDASKDSQPGSTGALTVQDTVTNVIHKGIGSQDKSGDHSKNTFLSEAIPLSNRVPEKVK